MINEISETRCLMIFTKRQCLMKLKKQIFDEIAQKSFNEIKINFINKISKTIYLMKLQKQNIEYSLKTKNL